MAQLVRSEIAERFCQQLERVREYLGLTQGEMAERLDISVSGYRKMMRGDVTKLDIFLAYKVHELAGVWLYEMIGVSNRATQVVSDFKTLTPQQQAYIGQIVSVEKAFNDQMRGAEASGDYVTMLIPTGNEADGMIYDSVALEHVDVSKYRSRFGSLISCALKITSNHLHPVYHEGDVLLICCEPPREGDTGIFINVKTNRVYLRRFRQASPCRLESIVNQHIPPILVDGSNEEDMAEWIKFGYVLTKMR